MECRQLLSIFRGTLFQRDDRVSTGDNRGKFHHWVVLLDPVDVDGEQRVLWVSLSSFKGHLNRSESYVFTDKSNKYLDGRNESSPFLRLARVTTVDRINAENPKRCGEIKEEHVAGICEALCNSGDAPENAVNFYREHQPVMKST